MIPLENKDIQTALREPRTLCYFLDAQGQADAGSGKRWRKPADLMKELVHAYSGWGTVERTLLTDIKRLMAQFPQMKTVAIFPQFVPDDVFDAARDGDFAAGRSVTFHYPRTNSALKC